MDDINEAMIVHNLRKRFNNDEIYVRTIVFVPCNPNSIVLQTNIGTILISVNPFKVPLFCFVQLAKSSSLTLYTQ